MAIYLIQAAGDSGPIKIGFAGNVAKRLTYLQIGCPDTLRLLAVVPGARADERELHHRFSPYRLRGEWFVAAPALLAFAASQPSPRAAEPTRPQLRHPLAIYLRETRTPKASLALRINVSAESIRLYCRGERSPSLDTMKRIREATGGKVQLNDWDQAAPPDDAPGVEASPAGQSAA